MSWATGFTDRFLHRLKSIADRLSRSLDRAIYKLDKFRRQLILRFYRALHIMERLFRVTWEIIKILVPILVTFLPPVTGSIIAFTLFQPFDLDSTILVVMSVLLFLLLLFAYFASEEEPGTDFQILQAQERLTYLTDLNAYSLGMKVCGVAVATGAFLGLWFLSPGLFVGIVLFLVEFGIVLLLPRLYINITPRPEDEEKAAA